MENRHIDETYTEIAAKLIQEEKSLEHIKNSNVTIVYLGSDLEKKSNRKFVYAQCEKVPDRFKWAVPCDFTITVFEPNVERFTDEQLEILLFHELKHVGIDLDGNEEVYYVVPHDVEDFNEILDRYGREWNDTPGKAKGTRT